MPAVDLVTTVDNARAQLARLVPLAVDTLQELAQGAERDNVRLAAAEAILDRTGLSRGATGQATTDVDQHRQADLAALELVAKLQRKHDVEQGLVLDHAPALDTLVVLEGGDDELPTAAPDTYTQVVDAHAV